MIPAVALLVTLLAVNSVAGRQAAEVSLSIDTCPSLPRDEIVRLVALDLGAPVLTPDSAGPQATRVGVGCDGSRIVLTISDPQTAKELKRSMALSARTENVTARMVALAISELVIASWVELTPGEASARTEGGSTRALDPARATPQAADAQPAAESSTGYVLVLAQATGPFSGVGLGWGGGFRIGWASGRSWVNAGPSDITGHPAIDLDLTGSWTEVGSSLGTVHVSMWSASPRVSFRLRRGRAWVDLGGGGRFGLARLVAAPLDPLGTRGGTLAATWAGPTGYVGAGLRLGPVLMAIGVEAGHVLRGVAGLVDDGTPISISGQWVSGCVALGWGS